MAVFPLLAVGFIMKVVAVLFFLCSVVLILIILIQKGRGGGLSSAFGGGMASGILGSKTGDFLTWVTIILVGIFLSLAVVMAKYYKPTVSEFGQDQTALQQQPTDLNQPLPTDYNEPGTTDVNESTDTNSPGG
ncbi:MAG: preprotein translocase subunit SecG [Sedimentisphaerales bacterium]